MAPLLPIKKRPSYRLLHGTREATQTHQGRGAAHLPKPPVSQAFISRSSMADSSERCMNNISFAFSSKETAEEYSNKTCCVERKKTGLTVSLKRKWNKDNEEPNNKTSSNHKLSTQVQKKNTGAALDFVKRRWVQGGNPSWESGQTSHNVPPPELPCRLEERIRAKGGRDIQMVIRKKITETDLNKQQGRLLIPCHQIREDACFLTKEEERFLNSHRKEKGKNEIRVMLMEPCGVDSEMALVKWNMQSSENYILRTGWNDAVLRNHKEEKHLKVDHFIQLWSFRVGPQLWFAIDVDIPSSSSDVNPDTCVVIEDKSDKKD